MHNKYFILGLLLTLTACSSDDVVSGGAKPDDLALTLDVAETDWQGESISVASRAGETLEGLKGTYPGASWDFTSETLTKEDLLNKTGLTFTPLGGVEENLTVVNVDGAKKAVRLHGTLTVRNLKAGQKVTIVFKTTDPDTPRILNFDNLTRPSGFTPPTTEQQTGSGYANANGDVVFTTTGPMYIYRVEVQQATDEGFGLYCEKLYYANTQVKWDNINSRWNIGANNYDQYWPRTQAGTLDIYAYAPFKPSPSPTYTVTSGKLAFSAERFPNMGPGMNFSDRLSGTNVDLLYAGAKHDLRNVNPAVLNFKHALAKLTFGTITNNTGEVINLKGFTVKGTLNSSANLDLSTGKWSDHVQWSGGAEASVPLPPPFVQVVHSAAELVGPPSSGYTAKTLIEPLADGETVIPNMPSNSLLLIPNADNDGNGVYDGKITVTIEVNNSTGENFSFPITLEEGKEKIVNITIGRNFEVVIE